LPGDELVVYEFDRSGLMEEALPGLDVREASREVPHRC